ncbi:Ecdysone 20-monooxygenase [Halotydeus destructor]|nr:Ecdysone 20-monooxygenase [Halotydeus destructor]
MKSCQRTCVNVRTSLNILRTSQEHMDTVRKNSSLATNSRSAEGDGVKDFSQVPGPRPSVPLIGTSWQYFKYIGRYDLFKLHEANLDKYRRFGKIVREEFQWGKPVVHLFDPNDFEKVFRSQGKCPARPPNEFVCHYRKKNPTKYPTIGMAHLLGDEWYKERQLLAPALLKLGVFQNHIGSQNQICDDWLKYLDWTKGTNDQLDDVQESTYRLALETICMMCLDSRMGCLATSGSSSMDGEVLIAATKLLFEAYQELYYGIPLWKLYETKSYKKLVTAEETLYSFASKYIDVALQRHKEQSGQNASAKVESVLETLLGIKGIDSRNVKITVLDFISAGIFTVSNSLAYMLHNLAANPNVQEKLYAELISVIGDKNEPITAEHLSRTPYLKACVKESFRLTSTVPTIVRTLPESTVLSGYEIPAGTTVFCHFLVCCQLDEHFPEPSKFEPERWQGKARQSIHPFILLPFGFGNRMCVGRRFSELQMYISTAKAVLNYKLETSVKHIDRTHAFIVIPAHPVLVKFKSRP